MSDELTEEEAKRFVEEQCRRWAGCSAGEFRQRHADGTLPDNGHVVHLCLLIGLPVGR